ncbi:alpha/beta hydrolase family protein [Deinococcus koreensis]|uniref:Dienelactone hydrolase n=1 Tax=Deinococcus koreensis TaxID=2054903 RepID=A0A2K3UUS2_9DEIO|nr:dienelactone hydrolase [Deinococcus koreensis]PNY80270.1 dienelactone hydrolase [Deinococcus koreensis]
MVPESGPQTPPLPASVPGDARPDAPALAPRGPHAVGVHTLSLVNPGQPDVTRPAPDGTLARTDRRLTVEVWYPTPGESGSGAMVYQDVIPSTPPVPYRVPGRATRDAPVKPEGPYPLVIVSHGYPGSRYFLSNLTENLASKGYVVAAIDHTGSTFGDMGHFAVTLLNRPTDILFTLAELDRLGAAGGDSPLSGAVDASRTAVVGYSMGGYGALNAAGAGFGPEVRPLVPGGALAGREAGAIRPDPRIHAVVALAPWGSGAAVKAARIPVGGAFGFWDAAGLAGLRVPTLFIAGEHDDVSGFEGGVKALFEHAVNAERSLLVYRGARHNIAGNPAPAIPGPISAEDFLRYAEPVWDTARLHNLNQHFITAFLGLHLKGQQDAAPYLQVPTPVASDASPDAPWPGFPARTAVGIELHHLNAGQMAGPGAGETLS